MSYDAMKWVFLAVLVVSAYQPAAAIVCALRFRAKWSKPAVVSLVFDLLRTILLLLLVREMFGAARESVFNNLWMWLIPVMVLGDEIVARLAGQESPWQQMWRHRNDPVWPSKPGASEGEVSNEQDATNN